MRYSQKKRLSVLAVVVLTVLTLQYLHNETTNVTTSVRPMVQAGHGLRVYIDPDTGEFDRPAEPLPVVEQQPAGSAQAFLEQLTGQNRPNEIRSPRAGGGFSIDLQERFRPSRRGADPLTGS